MGTGSIPFNTTSNVESIGIEGAQTTPVVFTLPLLFSGFFLARHIGTPPAQDETVPLTDIGFDWPWQEGVGSIPATVTITTPTDDPYRLYYSQQ